MLATALEDRIRAADRTLGLLDAEHNAGEEHRRDEDARAALDDLRRDRREAEEALAQAQRAVESAASPEDVRRAVDAAVDRLREEAIVQAMRRSQS